MTYDEALAAIRTSLDTAKANGDAYVGVPVAELDLVLTSLLEITPSEAGAVLATVRHDNEDAEIKAAVKAAREDHPLDRMVAIDEEIEAENPGYMGTAVEPEPVKAASAKKPTAKKKSA